jgi:hypothetical protein
MTLLPMIVQPWRVIWLQCKSGDDDIMLPKSLSVKDHVAA